MPNHPRPAELQNLESRRLLSVSLSYGELSIEGTNGPDRTVIDVPVGQPATLRVTHNGVRSTFRLGDVAQIHWRGYDGDDRFEVPSSLNIPVWAHGGRGNDTIKGGAAADTLIGSYDNDLIYGRGGDDRIEGGSGNDRLYGGDGRDTLFGHSGDDFLDGEAGDDRLDGSGGNDTLVGGPGADTLIGGEGDDLFQARDGTRDVLYHGLGRDTRVADSGVDTARSETIPAVTNLSASPRSPTSARLAWTWGGYQPTLARFDVVYRVAGTTAWMLGNPVSNAARSADVTGLTPDTRYEFGVRAVNVDALQSTRVAAFAQTTSESAVPPVTDLRVYTSNVGSVSLGWAWSGGPALSRFTTFYRRAGVAEWTTGPTASPHARSIFVERLSPDTPYEFRVRAVAADGTKSTSTHVTGRTTARPQQVLVTGVSADLASAGVEFVYFGSRGDLTRFEAFIRPAGTGTWRRVSDVNPASDFARFNGLVRGTTYEVRLDAIARSGGSRTESNVSRVTTAGDPQQRPVGVSTDYGGSTPTSVAVRWQLYFDSAGGGYFQGDEGLWETDVARFQVEYRPAGTSTWLNGPSVVVEPQAYQNRPPYQATIAGLAADRGYDVRVVAIRNDGVRGDTPAVFAQTFRTAPAGAAAPTNVRGWIDPYNPAGGNRSYNLTWQHAPGADGYVVLGSSRMAVGPRFWGDYAPMQRWSVLSPTLPAFEAFAGGTTWADVYAVAAVYGDAWVIGYVATPSGHLEPL